MLLFEVLQGLNELLLCCSVLEGIVLGTEFSFCGFSRQF